MSSVPKLLSADELWRMPDDGMRHELVRGEMTTMAPAGGGHGAATMNLSVPVGAFVRSHRLGVVFGSETGFVLSRNPDTVRAPDLAFIAASQIPAGGIGKRFIEGAPDLAVEVISPGDTLYEVDEKIGQWLQAGCRLVWVVNPHRRIVTAYRPDGTIRIHPVDAMLDGEDVLPGFTLKVAEIFEYLAP